MLVGRVTYILCVVILLIHTAARAQEPQPVAEFLSESTDSLSRRNSAAIFFERNLNTFNWIGRAKIDTTYGSTAFDLDEQYSSNIIQIDQTETRKRLQSNQNNVSLQVSHPVLPGLNTRAEWSSLNYSDDKAVGLSSASSYALLGGFEYVPAQFVAVSSMAGYRWEKQLAMSDKGPSYTLAADAHGIVLDGYQLAGTAQFHRDQLDPRILDRHFARIGAEKTFSGITRDSVLVSFSRNRREFYAFTINPSAGGESRIESRTENVFSFTNLLDYEIERNFLATLFVATTNRSLDRDLRSFRVVPDSTVQFDTEISEFRLDTYLQAIYRSDDSSRTASARFFYTERDEAHRATPPGFSSPNIEILFNGRNRQEQTKDNLSRRTSIAGTLGLPLSLSDHLSVSGTASILRYDTASELNVEDRDEQLAAVTIMTTHRISQFLDLSISLDGILSHVVYLLKERSANNNYNRILRLSPRVMYRPFSGFVSVNTFEVLANYTVYDFEEQVALVRSFSYRQFGWTDSTSIELSPKLGLDFFSYLKLYERGQLSWSDFTERPENSFVDKTYALQARFTPESGSQFAVGIRYFSQSRYTYEPAGKRLDLFLRSVGPTCSITWEVSQFSRLSLRGWYEQRQFADGAARSLANMSLNILINF
jgi:hypothetical protein